MERNSIMTIAAGRPLVDLVKLCYAADRPLLLEGGTGVGKSTILAGFAREQGIGFVCRDLSLMEPTDLVGLPKLKGDTTYFLPPASLPTKGEGLFVLEEINRAPQYMRGPCLQLLTERSLNDYQFPPGWRMAAAINPAEDGYEAAELDPALLSRFVRVRVRVDSDEWLNWARQNGVHGKVIDYVEAEPTVFDEPMSNPRAWTYVSELLIAQEKIGAEPQLLRVAIAGCVGPARAIAFEKFRSGTTRPLTAEQVLTAYRRHRKTLKGWIDDGSLDLVGTTLLNIQKVLQVEQDFDEVREDDKTWTSLGLFLSDLPGDFFDQAEEFFEERDYPLPPSPKTRKSK